MKFNRIAALVGASAVLSAAGVSAAQAGTHPKGGTYEVGGAGETIKREPTPLDLERSSFAPEVVAELPCGATSWDGGCG